MNKIEVVKQRDIKDCGSCSLSCIIKYYNGYVPLEKIRLDTCTNTNGTTAFNIIKAATNYGFEAYGVKTDKNIYDKNIFLPCIAHVVLESGLTHFIVVYKIANNVVYVMDPAKGKTKYQIDEFLKIWDGILILLSPKSDIACFSKEESLFSLFNKLVIANKGLFLKIVIVSIIAMALSLISNFYFQATITSIEESQDINFIKFLICIFGIIAIFKVIFEYMKIYFENYFNKNIDIVLFSNFLNHIFYLPLKNIQNRSTGEIITRVDELKDIKSLFIEVFINILLDMILVFGVIFVLYFINNKLFFVLCLILIIYVGIGVFFSKFIYRKVKENIEYSTDFNTVLVENVDMNVSIKNLNLTKEFNKRLEDKLIIFLKNTFDVTKFLNKVELLKSFIYEIGFFIVNTLGIYLIYKNELEILSLITFNSIITYLFNPIKNIIDTLPKYNYLKASFSKISEFISIQEEVHSDGLSDVDSGAINIKYLDFSYNQYKNILNDIKMNIKSGDKVLLSGPSGSGKSTICKLIYRHLDGYKGIIDLDKANEKDYSLDSIRENILYVGQNEFLFTGTIKENVICYRNISDEEFLNVCKICRLEEIVSKRPFRYDTVINATINNLSGGEKQRIILARALLKKSKILILDEALSEVNITLEKDILKDIFKYYKSETLIYVTHKNVDDMFEKIIRMGKTNDNNI